MGSEPNGIKLSSSTLLYQDFTGFTPWFCEEWIRFGPAFDGTRLHAARTVGIDDQGRQRFSRTSRAEPPQGIDEADPLQGHILPLCRGQHHDADEVVDEREDGQLLQNPDEAFAVQHIEAHRLFEVPEITLDLPPRPVEGGQGIGGIQVDIKQGGDQGHRLRPKAGVGHAVAQFTHAEDCWERGEHLRGEPLRGMRGQAHRLHPLDELVRPAQLAEPTGTGQALVPRRRRGGWYGDETG
jgi:hypothetical protein